MQKLHLELVEPKRINSVNFVHSEQKLRNFNDCVTLILHVTITIVERMLFLMKITKNQLHDYIGDTQMNVCLITQKKNNIFYIIDHTIDFKI